MNLKDLQNIDIRDLKNIDWYHVKDQVLSRPDLIIMILLVFVTFIVTTSTYGKFKATTGSLREKVVKLMEKLEALDKFEITQQQYDDFKKKCP